MKKSIFLFFAAILCAMSVNAKTIYLKPNSNWTQANAWFAVCLCNGSESPNWHKMTKSTADPSIYQVEIADAKLDKTANKNIIFVRMNPAKTALSWDSKWNQTGDLDITKLATNNCCAINSGQWDCGTNVTWSTYTPPTEPVKYTWTVAGTPASVFEVEWEADHDANDMVEQADGTYKWEKTNIEFADDNSTVKFKVCQDHAWDVAYPAQDYSLNIPSAGVYTITITFNAANNAVNATATKTAEYEGEAPTHTYSVVGSNADLFGTAWDPAVEANLMETADNVTYTWKKEGVTLMGNFEMKVVQDKAFSVSYPAQNKVVEITEPAIYTVSITFNATSHDIDVNLTNTGEAVIPPVKLYFVNTGNWTDLKAHVWADGGNPYKAWEESESMTDTGDDVYGFDVYSYEFPSNYNRIIFKGANDQKTSDDVAAYDAAKPYYCNGVWYASLSEIPAPESLTYTVTVPEGTEECWIAGQMNNWTLTKMNPGAAANQFTLDIVGAAIDHEYKYACKNDWAYAEVREADENGNSNRKAWAVSDEVTAWGKPVVYTYYLMGVNDDWATGIEMEVNIDAENEVMLTCQPVNGQVKIKRLGDDASEHWYGAHSLKAEEGNLGTNADAEGGDGNIALAEGIYNFYFDTADGKLWIAAATDCVTEPTEKTIVEENAVCTIGRDGSLTMEGQELYVEIGEFDAENVLPEYVAVCTLLSTWDGGTCEAATATLNDNVLTLTGTFVTEESGETYKFTISGELPSGEVESQEVNVVVANLVVEYDSDSEVWVLFGTDDEYTFTLALNEEPVAEKEYTLNEDNSQVRYSRYRSFVTGSLTKQYDDTYGDMYVGQLSATFDDVPYTISLKMYNYTVVDAEPIDLSAEATYTIEDDMLTVVADWEGTPVQGILVGFENVSGQEFDEVWLSVGEGEDEFYISGSAVVTIEDGIIGIEGLFTFADEEYYNVYIWGDIPATEPTPDYTRAVTKDQWGTICLPYASSSFTGATFYEVSSLVYGEGLWLDQLAAGTQLVAGKPYIFKATATEITVTYTGEAVSAPVEEDTKGLTGTFTGIAAGGVLVDNYIIAKNKVWVANANNSLPANRAYINAASVPTTTQAEIPGRRRVLMGENAATGVDNIVAPEGQAVKAIVNGQLIIIRDGVKYNVQGQVIR